MNMRIVKLRTADYRTSTWSGGTTTQLVIFPPEAEYADRDFLWRISSATVDLEVSEFTLLPDYDRLICTLEGNISLSHNERPSFPLHPYQVHAFSGADRTRSEGKCKDFNLMLRRGKAEGKMGILRSGDSMTLNGNKSEGKIFVFCAQGFCKLRLADETESLKAGESLLLSAVDKDLPVSVTEAEGSETAATLIVCQMRRF